MRHCKQLRNCPVCGKENLRTVYACSDHFGGKISFMVREIPKFVSVDNEGKYLSKWYHIPKHIPKEQHERYLTLWYSKL